MKKIAIVTACPSGVANSIIAAGLLQKASETLVVMSDCLAFLAEIHIFVKKSLKH